MSSSTGFNNSVNLTNSSESDTSKSFSTRYNDPSKWAAEKKQNLTNQSKFSAVFKTVISTK